MKSYRREDKWFAASVAILFVILSAAVIIASRRSYNDYYAQFEAETAARLTSIVELKANEIGLWRRERLGDAALFQGDRFFAELAANYFANNDEAAQNQLQAVLKQYVDAYGYQRVMLLDADGVIRVAWPELEQPRLWPHYEKLAAAQEFKDVFSIDLHRGRASDDIHLSNIIPIQRANDQTPLGYVVFQISPHLYLYPTLEELPVLGEVGDLLLLRQEGDYLTLLNNPEPEDDVALRLHFPTGEMACAVPPGGATQTTVTSGIDYRGRSVVAAARAVPHSDWLLVACVERETLYAATQDRGRLLFELAGLLILFLATGGYSLWRWQRGRFYQQKYEAEQALRAAEAQAKAEADLLRNLARQAPGFLFQYRLWPDGRSSFPYASEGIRAIFEMEPELAQKDAALAFERLHPDDYEQVVSSINASSKNIQPWRSIHRVILPERGERWIEGIATPEKMADGSVLWHGIITDVTDRKAMEAELTSMIAQFVTAESIAHFGVWEMDIETGATSWSDEFFRICGLEPRSLQPTTEIGMQIIHPDDRERAGLAVNKAIQETGVYNIEKRIVRPNGEVREVQSVGRIVRDEAGKPVKLTGAFLDITERKAAEAALQASEQRYTRLFEAAHDAILIADDNNRYVDANPAACHLLGYSLEELLKLGANDIVVRADEIDARWNSFVQNGQQYGEIMLRRKDGGVIYAEYRAVANYLPGRHFSALRDITERKQYERELRQAQRRYEALFEQGHDAVFILNLEGSKIDANQRATDLLGYTVEELKRYNHASLSSDPEKSEAVRQRLLAGEYIPTYERDLRKKEGSLVTVEFNVELVRDSDGRPLHIQSIARDITERKKAEQDLHESHQSLQTALKALQETQNQLIQQERLAAVGQLAAGIAHDFNNILAVILLYAQMLNRSQNLPEWEQEAIITIEKQTKTAAALVQQILDFSRRSILELTPIDLLPILNEQVNLLQRTLPEDIVLSFRINQPGPYMIKADAARVQQIILNLAVNSRDAMPQGGQLTIEMDKFNLAQPERELAAGKWISLRVADSGEGIPEEAQPYIFEPFFTTKEPNKGSGLGLAQAQGIVAQHNGRIEFESAVGQGTSFTIYLPAILPPPQTTNMNHISILSGQNETILLVEDNHTVRMAISQGLEQLNFRVLTAANGKEALSVLEKDEGQIDAIISDMIMPGMGGAALFREIRRRGWQIPMLMLTGHYLDAEVDGLLAEGLNDWLSKPVSLDELLARLEKLLRGE